MTSLYSGYQTLTFERDGEVLIVRLDRPETLNAVSRAMHTELARVFRDIAHDEGVKAVVLTGAGRGFSAGGDLDDLPSAAGPDLDRLFREARTLIVDLLELPQPIIAAVNGPAVGLGATIALFCDITFMSRTALIADPHVVVGVSAGDGGAVIWPWLVGMKRAKEYLMTGDKVTAEEALELGLVNRVVEPDVLLAEATAFAQRLAGLSPRGVQATKAALNNILRSTVVDVLDQSLASEKECFTSGDHERAVEVFRAAQNARRAEKSA